MDAYLLPRKDDLGSEVSHYKYKGAFLFIPTETKTDTGRIITL